MSSPIYTKSRIVTDRDLAMLNKIYDQMSSKRVKRLYNLFYVERRELWPEYVKEEDKTWWDSFTARMEAATGLRTYAHYFLEYTPGSFCRKHSDNAAEIGHTLVTLIDKSDDLDGGESLGFLPHFKKDYYPFDINRYKEGDDENVGNTIIPVVMHQKIGESLSYDNNFQHGVSLVNKGRRRVLISWFKREDFDKDNEIKYEKPD